MLGMMVFALLYGLISSNRIALTDRRIGRNAFATVIFIGSQVLSPFFWTGLEYNK